MHVAHVGSDACGARGWVLCLVWGKEKSCALWNGITAHHVCTAQCFATHTYTHTACHLLHMLTHFCMCPHPTVGVLTHVHMSYTHPHVISTLPHTAPSEMNHETSLLVFVGPYLQDNAVRAKVSEAFKAMTSAFLAFPLCFPGTAVWKGKQGRLYILSVLKVSAAESKQAMKVLRDWVVDRGGLWKGYGCRGEDTWVYGLRTCGWVGDNTSCACTSSLLVSQHHTCLTTSCVSLNTKHVSQQHHSVLTTPSFSSQQHTIILFSQHTIILLPQHTQAGQEPRCLMDFWAQNCNAEIEEAAAKGEQPGRHTTDEGMADSVMDFLFASQDASTASLVWSICLCADHPEVLAKVWCGGGRGWGGGGGGRVLGSCGGTHVVFIVVRMLFSLWYACCFHCGTLYVFTVISPHLTQVREEQHRLRPDLNKTIDGALLAEMTYTRQVVREILRYRPPAPMVPQVCDCMLLWVT